MKHHSAHVFVPAEMYFIEPKHMSSKYQYQDSLLVRPHLFWSCDGPSTRHGVCTSSYKALSLGYSHGAELLSPYNPQRPWMVSGPVHFGRSLYAVAQVTRWLFFEVLISIPFTGILLTNSVSSMCLRELYTDPVGEPREEVAAYCILKHTDNWKQSYCGWIHSWMCSHQCNFAAWHIHNAQSYRQTCISPLSSSMFLAASLSS